MLGIKTTMQTNDTVYISLENSAVYLIRLNMAVFIHIMVAFARITNYTHLANFN